jgi:uncharacterized DUF497 family protein
MISSGAAIMTDGDFDAIFADIREFEWDEKKRERNWRIHRVDFNDARSVLDNYALIRRSDRHSEVRYQIFGYVDEREVTVICTIRKNCCRIISARRARKDERRKYYGRLPGRTPEGQD